MTTVGFIEGTCKVGFARREGVFAALREALQMKSDELAEPVAAKADAHEPLHDVHVGIAIPLDDDGSVIENGDIPADNDAVAEDAMGVHRQPLGFLPIGKHQALNRRARVRMRAQPAEPRIRAEVARS